MAIDTAFFHEVCIYVLYGCVGILTFVLVERLVYFSLLKASAGRIRRSLLHSSLSAAAVPDLSGRGLMARSLTNYVQAQELPGASRNRIEDLSGRLFLDVNGRVTARLWILDTIVTAAPLLGLIGTILGIMDTFNALSSGGVSDPAAVSRGIAAALAATAIGIGTALYGLLAFNLLHRLSEVIVEEFKGFMLTLTR